MLSPKAGRLRSADPWVDVGREGWIGRCVVHGAACRERRVLWPVFVRIEIRLRVHKMDRFVQYHRCQTLGPESVASPVAARAGARGRESAQVKSYSGLICCTSSVHVTALRSCSARMHGEAVVQGKLWFNSALERTYSQHKDANECLIYPSTIPNVIGGICHHHRPAR